MTQKTLLRGRILTFHDDPEGPEETPAYTYIENGALIVAQGRILAMGAHSELIRMAQGAQVIDHRPHLLMPGFIDPHIPFPQVQAIASWGRNCLTG